MRAALTRRDLPNTATYVFVGLLVLLVMALLPVAFGNAYARVRHSGDLRVFGDREAIARANYRLHLDITEIDDVKGVATLRATATRRCEATCGDAVGIQITSGLVAENETILPVQVLLTIPAGSPSVSQEIDLPVFGDPIRYPFDHWELGVLAAPVRILPDGGVQPLSLADAGGDLVLTAQNRAARIEMHPLANAAERLGVDVSQDASVLEVLAFDRPSYLQVLTVALVLLMSLLVGFAVMLTPIGEILVIGGDLVLGIWGLRAILLGTDLAIVTIVDLAFMALIVLMLLVIVLRMLGFLEARTRFRLIGRFLRLESVESETTIADHVPSATPGVVSAAPDGRGGD